MDPGGPLPPSSRPCAGIHREADNARTARSLRLRHCGSRHRAGMTINVCYWVESRHCLNDADQPSCCNEGQPCLLRPDDWHRDPLRRPYLAILSLPRRMERRSKLSKSAQPLALSGFTAVSRSRLHGFPPAEAKDIHQAAYAAFLRSSGGLCAFRLVVFVVPSLRLVNRSFVRNGVVCCQSALGDAWQAALSPNLGGKRSGDFAPKLAAQ